TMTFLAALRHDRIAAPCLLDGPINGTSFLAWIQQFLLPTLNPYFPDEPLNWPTPIPFEL
nr:hypothetical protein [Arenimonas sp.]